MSFGSEFYLHLAIQKAWSYQLLTYPNPAVACLIRDKHGNILSLEAHQKAGEAHAELLAVKSALQTLKPEMIFPSNPSDLHEFISRNHNNLLHGAKVYLTLEPCNHVGKTPPCSDLLLNVGIDEIFIGHADHNPKARGGAKKLQNAGVKTHVGVCENECFELLEPFLRWQKGNFVFFKLAMSLNGVITGGNISCLKARTHMHSIRNVCDQILIGGNTIRIDNPYLDSRLVSKKAPNVTILSKDKDFSSDLNVFKAPNRSVEIRNDINLSEIKGLCMIEGGENFLNFFKDKIDYFLIYHGSHFSKTQNLQTSLKLKTLYTQKIENEFFTWYKNNIS